MTTTGVQGIQASRLPSLSVVTITYNDPVGLKKTLSSLRDLDLDWDWEHIVADSSPELNEEVLSTLPNDWPLIRHMPKPNGIFVAMNEGMRFASKDFVIFLNGGDCIKSCKTLRGLLEILGEDPAVDILIAGADLERDGEYQYTRIPASNPLRNLLGSNKICHQAVIYKRHSLTKIGDFDHEHYKNTADYDHLYRFFLAGSRWFISKQALVVYDLGGNSSVHYPEVLSEFRQVQAAYAYRLSTKARWANLLLSRINEVRMYALKAVAASFAGERLRPLWTAWNRQKAALQVRSDEVWRSRESPASHDCAPSERR